MIKGIQGLRAIAILMVLFIHILGVLPQEYHHHIYDIQNIFFTSTGVEIFFVISGYLLMHSLNKFNSEKEGNCVQFAIEFVIKKFKRLAPPVYFWSFIALLFSLLSLFLNNIDTNLWQAPIIAIKKFFSTLLWLRNFTEALEPHWLGIFWAVSLEFQVFSVVAIIYFILGRSYVVFLSIFFIVLMMFYRFGGEAAWLFRFDPILYGVLLYEIIKKLGENKLSSYLPNKKYLNMYTISFILLLGSTLKVFENYPNFSISISALVASLMMIFAISGNGYFYSDIKPINFIIEWLASRSYSLYCCHIVTWFLVKQYYILMDIVYDELGFFISIALMIFFTELSYRYVESINKTSI